MTRDAAGTLATGWVEHLRAGGTTPWPRWVRRATAGDLGGPADQARPAAAAPAEVPGAAQLELLRRLNELGALPHRVDHVLSRPAPGRGPVHLRLPSDPPGPPAPTREVLRVATGVLADLTAELTPARVSRRRRRRGPRPVEGLPAFLLEGPPVTVAEVRARLAAAGMPEHRPGPTRLRSRPDTDPEVVVVLLAPVDEALRQAWAARVQRGAGRAWPRFVARWAGRGALPPSVAVDSTVDHWATRVGAGNVHLVAIQAAVDPADQVAALLGHPLPLTRPDGGTAPAGQSAAESPVDRDPVRLPPAVVDALRRVNVVLPFVCAQADRPPRRTALLRLVRGADGRRDPWAFPEPQRGWAEANAGRIVDALTRAGCVVHGDLEALRSLGAPSNRRVGEGEVLDAMVRMIHRVDAELGGGSGRGRSGR